MLEPSPDLAPSRARILVVDHGPGIAPEMAAHVFERFWRSDPARVRAQGGAGLGLSIVSAVADAHGGHVWITETPGGGATFTVELPTEPEPGPSPWGSATTAGEPASGGGTTTGGPPATARHHLLRSGPSCLRRDNASESGRTCRHGTERLAVTSSPGRANRVHRSDPNSPPGRLRRVRRRGSLLCRERLSHHRPAVAGSATRPTSPPAPPPDLVPHAVLRPGNLCRRPLPGRALAASTPRVLASRRPSVLVGGDERFTQAAPRR